MENKILELFLYNNRMKFSEIEKGLKERSNKLSYHLKQLVKKGVLLKNKGYYELSEASELMIPYLSEKKAVLPAILIHIGGKNKAFLHKREKKPFKSFLSLPGGRLLINESIEQGAKRIMKEKFNKKITFKKIKSVSLEHVKKQNTIHSFLLILVSVQADVPLTEVSRNKSKIIPSDYRLIKNPDSEVEIKTIVTNIFIKPKKY
jgi:ADP-ribose pyrophosphatase YjhB (NUDIX family)